MSKTSFQDLVQQIIDWNKIAGNSPEKFNRHLETSMLTEELAESVIALKEDDKVELVDGILDIFYIGVGTLYKKGFTSEQITQCMEEIVSSNYTKFVKDSEGNYQVQTDDTGKVTKPKEYKKPNLKQYL